jgi:hypothetical protein
MLKQLPDKNETILIVLLPSFQFLTLCTLRSLHPYPTLLLNFLPQKASTSSPPLAGKSPPAPIWPFSLGLHPPERDFDRPASLYPALEPVLMLWPPQDAHLPRYWSCLHDSDPALALLFRTLHLHLPRPSPCCPIHMI